MLRECIYFSSKALTFLFLSAKGLKIKMYKNVISLMVLHGYREENGRLEVFEKKAPVVISGSIRGKWV
jgi:hypothetical protein